MIVPAVAVRVGADGKPVDHDDRRGRWPRSSSRQQPPPPPAAAFSIAPGDAGRRLPPRGGARSATRCATGTLTKAVIAREIAVTADRPIDVHGVLTRLEAAFGSSYRYSVDGFVGASPELLVEVDGRTRALVPAGRHGAADRRRRPRRARSPSSCWPARRTRSSTGS